MRSALLAVLGRWRAAPVLQQDAFFYCLAALFALSTALVAGPTDYREWGAMSLAPYLIAAIVCTLADALFRRDPIRRISMVAVRKASIIFLLIGAVIVPLAIQLTWRAESHPGAQAQVEVAVIERAGDRAAVLRDPYLSASHLSASSAVGNSPQSDSRSIDQYSFFPYLPGMIPFGMLNAVDAPGELIDARVVLAAFTIGIAALSLALSNAPRARKARVLQFLVVLPSGALPMVTGGDDLPVLALLLLGVVLAARRQPVLAGLVVGAASTLKFTAWPVLILLGWCVRDSDDVRAPIRYGLAASVVALPVLAAGVVPGPAAFVYNVVRFPLGLTPVRSPAASPLLGQVLVNIWPSHRHLITITLLLVGFAIVLVAFNRRTPRTAAAAARFTGFTMCVATVLAPATRFGYLIYPANLFVFAYLLDGRRFGELLATEADYSSSSTSNSLSDSALVSAMAAPESAGLSAGLASFTVTPTSQ